MVSYRYSIAGDVLRADQDAGVLECPVLLESPEVRFGAVVHGEIRMRGRLRPVRLSFESRVDIGFPWVTRSQNKLEHTRVIFNENWRYAEERCLSPKGQASGPPYTRVLFPVDTDLAKGCHFPCRPVAQ